MEKYFVIHFIILTGFFWYVQAWEPQIVFAFFNQNTASSFLSMIFYSPFLPALLASLIPQLHTTDCLGLKVQHREKEGFEV